jgi:hypothetical protein
VFALLERGWLAVMLKEQPPKQNVARPWSWAARPSASVAWMSFDVDAATPYHNGASQNESAIISKKPLKEDKP